MQQCMRLLLVDFCQIGMEIQIDAQSKLFSSLQVSLEDTCQHRLMKWRKSQFLYQGTYLIEQANDAADG